MKQRPAPPALRRRALTRPYEREHTSVAQAQRVKFLRARICRSAHAGVAGSPRRRRSREARCGRPVWRCSACAAGASRIMPARRPGTDATTLHRYAADTWASFVAMTDPATGLPTDQLQADGTRDARPPRPTSAPTCGARSRPSASGSSPTPSSSRGSRRRSGRSSTWSATSRRPVLQLVRPPDGAKMTTDEAGNPRDADPLLRRQRLARDRAAHRREQRARGRRARPRDLRLDGLRLLLRPGAEPHPLPLRPRAPATGPCCYDTLVSESRIADYVGIAKGELPRKEYYGRWRTFPDTCDWAWLETRPLRLRPHLRRRRASSTAATRTRGPG